MFRFAVQGVVAALAVLALAACQPEAKINVDDPYATLHPWNHKWKQVKKTPSGVEYIVVKKGDGKGPHPSPADRVTVQYDGRFAKEGTTFDSTYGSDPETFRLNQVIPGWTEGLQRMQPGDEFMFWIPSDLGYGARGSPGGIPPNADLMFRVELKNVIPAAAADPAAWKKVTPWPTDSSDVIRTSSGLEYMVIDHDDNTGRQARLENASTPVNTGPPDDNDFAIVHFEGRLEDGSQVASTFETQETQTFPIAQLTPGWAETLKMMRPGDHWMVKMPPGLMYGAEGDGRIPPNATVIFEVRLEDVIRIDPPPEPSKSDPAPKPGKPAKPKGKPN